MARHQRYLLVVAAILTAVSLPSSSWGGTTGPLFVLEDGTLIQGEVVAADNEVLTIESPSLGRVRVSRDSVRRVQDPVPKRVRHTSAHQRLAPTADHKEVDLDLRIQEGEPEPEPEELLERALSIRLADPLPAKLAE